MAFADGGKTLFAASWGRGAVLDVANGTATEWTRPPAPAPGEQIAALPAAWQHQSAGLPIALNGERGLVAWFDGRETLVLDARTGEPKLQLRGQTGLWLPDAAALAFSPDGQTLVSAHGDSTLRIWRLP